MVDRDVLVGRVARAVAEGPDLVTLWQVASEVLARAVPHFEAPCFFTVDPESRLITSHFQEGLPEIPAEWLGREYAQPDFNSMSEVLASPRGYGTLHEATEGRPQRSAKFHEEMQPFGCEQELVVALRGRGGEAWGAVGLYREGGQPLFSDEEIAFVTALAPLLADGARFALLAAQARDPDLSLAPGLVVLDERQRLRSRSPQAHRWLQELGGDLDRLPAAAAAVAGAALGEEPDRARARVLGTEGRWIELRATCMDGAEGREVAVLMQPAEPGHLSSLLMGAHGLTERERAVTELVIRGLSTTSGARTLAIADETFQRHLQNVFAKTATRSRGELVSLLFRTHYEPRVRDNERRTSRSAAARHGPMPGPGG